MAPGATPMSLLASVLLALGCLSISAARAATKATPNPNAPLEAAALASAARAWKYKFAGWRTWRVANPCSKWAGLTCNAAHSVQDLDLQGRGVKGVLPAALGTLHNLTALKLQNNSLSGAIPSNWSSLISLQHLNLGSNKISGKLPGWIGSLLSLTYLSLADNSMRSSIPAGVTSLLHLQHLHLAQNKLWGPLPDLLHSLRNLKTLDIAWNSVSGQLPPSFRNAKPTEPGPALQILNVSGNSLYGEAVGVEHLPSLLFLDLRYNFFAGRIPADWGNSLAPSRGQIHLDSNYFTGTSVIRTTADPGVGPLACLRDVSVRNTVTGNCIDITQDKYTQKGRVHTCPPTPQKAFRYCWAFCNVTSPGGPCAGHGVCRLSGPTKVPSCVCDEGYKQPRKNPATCTRH